MLSMSHQVARPLLHDQAEQVQNTFGYRMLLTELIPVSFSVSAFVCAISLELSNLIPECRGVQVTPGYHFRKRASCSTACFQMHEGFYLCSVMCVAHVF